MSASRLRLAAARLLFLGGALGTTTLLTVLFADLMLRMDFSPAKGVLVFLFSVLTLNTALGTFQALLGFGTFLRRAPHAPTAPPPSGYRPRSVTAINVPVYNEDIQRVLEGVRAVHNSLQRLGFLDHFHFYILSDSTQPDKWVMEEASWALLCRQLNAQGRIFYRRRRDNTHQKAGNILQFCEAWGRKYPFMVIFDADSVMDGETLVEMVRRMEADERIGILQTVPRLARSESLHGRLQQFANSAFGPLFSAGMAAWTGPHGNYWGHNAILRVEPFIQHCALPDLPGRQPWGGKILSHDFVEAALMIRATYKVVLAPDLCGSFEEGPPNLLEALKRDRRWCQGNLQHIWLLFAEGLRSWSKLHFMTGILSYGGALLWALFLTLGAGLAFDRHRSGLRLIPRPSSLPLPGDLSLSAQGLLVFGMVLTLLLLPKLLVLLLALRHRDYREAHGGSLAFPLNVLLEILLSTLIAPVMMVFHARFVLATLFAKGIRWTTQTRGAHGLAWRDLMPPLLPLSVFGLLSAFLAFRILGPIALWTLPLHLGWILAPLLTRLTSKPLSGFPRLLATPADLPPPPILQELSETLALHRLHLRLFDALPTPVGLIAAIVDPQINAIHVTLLKEAPPPGNSAPPELDDPAAFFRDDPALLPPARQMALLCDRPLIRRLHHEVWRQPTPSLHPSWRKALDHYALPGT